MQPTSIIRSEGATGLIGRSSRTFRRSQRKLLVRSTMGLADTTSRVGLNALPSSYRRSNSPRPEQRRSTSPVSSQEQQLPNTYRRSSSPTPEQGKPADYRRSSSPRMTRPPSPPPPSHSQQQEAPSNAFWSGNSEQPARSSSPVRSTSPRPLPNNYRRSTSPMRATSPKPVAPRQTNGTPMPNAPAAWSSSPSYAEPAPTSSPSWDSAPARSPSPVRSTSPKPLPSNYRRSSSPARAAALKPAVNGTPVANSWSAPAENTMSSLAAAEAPRSTSPMRSASPKPLPANYRRSSSPARAVRSTSPAPVAPTRQQGLSMPSMPSIDPASVQRYLQSSITRNAFGLNKPTDGSGIGTTSITPAASAATSSNFSSSSSATSSSDKDEEGNGLGVLGAVAAGVTAVAGAAAMVGSSMYSNYYSGLTEELNAAEGQLTGLLERYNNTQANVATIKEAIDANAVKQAELEKASRTLAEVFQKLVNARGAFDQLQDRSAIDQEWLRVALAMKEAQEAVQLLMIRAQGAQASLTALEQDINSARNKVAEAQSRLDPAIASQNFLEDVKSKVNPFNRLK